MTAETTAVDGEQITDIAYSYDELGQLKTVKAGSDIETSYTYNIQGWLTKKSTDKSILKPRLASINSGLIIDRDSLIMPPGDIIQPLQTNIFTQTLEYFSPKHAQPRYAGNIAETSWKRGSNAEADTYAYTYDRLGRLVDGRFISGGQLLTKQYGERNITYDKNTNILSLTRYNGSRIGTLYQYTYDGNRKLSVTSEISADITADYGYQYDIMGNISKIGAENLLISYNYLNLPKIITKTGTPRSSDGATYVVGVTRPTASYIYLADGTKVQAIGETGQGYEYLGSLRLSVNSSNVDIESIPFAGGRIVKTSNGYEPQYYITDHLGSTRTVVKPNATVVAEFDYMPYGTQHAVAGAPITEADYKYTGKEQQTAFGLDNLYDSQARFQYVKDGMFLSHDDLAGKFPWLSTYNYCAGNPINKVDPDGRLIDDYFNYDGKYLGSDNASTDLVRIIRQDIWDTLKEVDNINDKALQGSSVLFSKARMSDESVLEVYGHYNMTGEKIIPPNEKTKVMTTHITFSTNEETQAITGIKEIAISIGIKYRTSGLFDNRNNIISSFEHEYGHVCGARQSPQEYYDTPEYLQELSAIWTQRSTDTFKKTTTTYKLLIGFYAIRMFRGK